MTWQQLIGDDNHTWKITVIYHLWRYGLVVEIPSEHSCLYNIVSFNHIEPKALFINNNVSVQQTSYLEQPLISYELFLFLCVDHVAIYLSHALPLTCLRNADTGDSFLWIQLVSVGKHFESTFTSNEVKELSFERWRVCSDNNCCPAILLKLTWLITNHIYKSEWKSLIMAQISDRQSSQQQLKASLEQFIFQPLIPHPAVIHLPSAVLMPALSSRAFWANCTNFSSLFSFSFCANFFSSWALISTASRACKNGKLKISLTYVQKFSCFCGRDIRDNFFRLDLFDYFFPLPVIFNTMLS